MILEGDGSNRGAAYAEFAIVLPLLLALFSFVVDFGQALAQYYNMQRVAYEAASFGATQILPVGSGGAAHGAVESRAATLLDLQDRYLVPGYASNISSSLSWDPVQRKGVVEVRISGEILALFGAFDIPVSVASRSAYLLNLWPSMSFQSFNNPPELRDCQNNPISGCAPLCSDLDPLSGLQLPITRCVSSCSSGPCLP